jgi:hypothetical protein
VRLYDVRAQQASLAYQRIVLNALHEVENALAAYGADQQRRAWLDATVTQSRETLSLARASATRAGLANFIEVLDAERTLAAEPAVAGRQYYCGGCRSGAPVPRAGRRLADGANTHPPGLIRADVLRGQCKFNDLRSSVTCVRFLAGLIPIEC